MMEGRFVPYGPVRVGAMPSLHRVVRDRCTSLQRQQLQIARVSWHGSAVSSGTASMSD
jgi:hypothetical protein